MSENNNDNNIEKSQPVLNIGLVGHVDHGKTTLTEALSGRWTDTHSEELKRGITIRLGYADCVIRKIPNKEGIESYTVKKEIDGVKTNALKKISLVDAPGHESLMATMLSGATIMDGAILLIAANEECPQPQTKEHLMALEIMGIEKVIVVQNKIDLVSPQKAKENQEQIKEFLKHSKFKDSPIIPISAQHNVNIDVLLEKIDKSFEVIKRDDSKEPMMYVARSFDINKPGITPDKLKGGVLGGSLKQGVLKTGDEIELRPGKKITENNQTRYEPIKTKIISIVTGGNPVKEAAPGGSIAIATSLDPAVVKSDTLTGSLIGHPGKLPDVLEEMTLNVNLLERVVGSQQDLNVEPIKIGESLMLNVNSSSTVGVVSKTDQNETICKLKLPVCAQKGARVTISRLIGTRFRLIGYGILE